MYGIYIFVTIFLVNSAVLSYSDSSYDEEAYVSIEEKDYAVPIPCKEFCGVNKRDKRLTNTPIRSRIVEAMKMTRSLHINPAEPDIFSLFRDKYELPKG